jgi:hypothetical protein
MSKMQARLEGEGEQSEKTGNTPIQFMLAANLEKQQCKERP